MTAPAIHHPRRSVLPVLNLLLAGGAAALGVIALTSDDVGAPLAPPAPAVAPAADAPAPAAAAAPAVHAARVVDDVCGLRIRGVVAC